MKSLGPKFGIAVGIVTAPLLVFPLLKLFLGHCFFEQGCGTHEQLKLAGVFLAACVGGLAIGWIVAKLAKAVVEHRSRKSVGNLDG